MLLCEEYAKRQGVCDKDFVRYLNEGSVFFKTGNGWYIHNFKWQAPEKHPGKYEFQILRPIHNNYERQFTLETAYSDELLRTWDKYENHIIDWTNNVRIMDLSPTNYKEICLVAWEIFTCGFEGYFLKENLSKAVAESLNLNLSVDKRFEIYQNIFLDISYKSRLVKDIWRIEFEEHIDNYCVWWAELLNKHYGNA